MSSYAELEEKRMSIQRAGRSCHSGWEREAQAKCTSVAEEVKGCEEHI
jgi:hypothetical protein